MNYFLNSLILTFLAFPIIGHSQGESTFDFEYEVFRTFTTFSISKTQLEKAETLIDLNQYYKAKWVKEYISVEVWTSQDGKELSAISKNDQLSKAQKENMINADAGSVVSVTVKYLPDNQLKNNEAKSMNFTFLVDPDREASYPGGHKALKQYLSANAIDQLSPTKFRKHHLTAVKFSINDEGQVVDTQLFEPSGDEATDDLLLKTIRKMPCWQPAEYADGTKVKQDFVLAVGDMQSCVINLLNIKKD